MIFVLADTHVPERMDSLPRRLLDRIKSNDLILHAGDFVEWDVYRQLADTATLHAVCGNMDQAELREFLPQRLVLELKGKKIGMCHGSGPPAGLEKRVLREFGEKCDVLIFGHSHVPYNRKIGDTLVFNPGSLSWNMASPFDSTYGILTIEGDDVWAEIVELD